jgi:hypothetical protein
MLNWARSFSISADAVPTMEWRVLRTWITISVALSRGGAMLASYVPFIILNLLTLGVGVWSVRRGQRQLAALPPAEVRFMRQGSSVAFWFCQGGAFFFVVYGVRIFGVLDYRLATLIWLFAAVFCVCGIWVRHMTYHSTVLPPASNQDTTHDMG